MLDKQQQQINQELRNLRLQIKEAPLETGQATLLVAQRAEKMLYHRGAIEAKVIISLCHWYNMSYSKGLKFANEAATIQDSLASDEFSGEINHLRGLHHYGLADYFTAQHHWNLALEQAALDSNSKLEVECLIGLSNVWCATGERTFAQGARQLATEIANHNGFKGLEKRAHILLAISHYLQNEFLEMLMELDAADEIDVERENLTTQAEISNYRGLAMLNLERYLDAHNAILHAFELCEQHGLVWMSAHTHIARARLAISQREHQQALQLLSSAERIASAFDNGQIMEEIYLCRSQAAEAHGEYQRAFDAYKLYSEFCLHKYHHYTRNLTHNSSVHASKKQLDLRSQKLLNRLRHIQQVAQQARDGALLPESLWWEKLVLFKTQFNQTSHSVILIRCHHENVAKPIAKLLNSLTNKNDYLAILNTEFIGLLIAEKDDAAEHAFVELNQLLSHFPWKRMGLPTQGITASLHPLTHFPFTLEQLTDFGE